MAFRTNKTPVLQEKSASGAVATFNTALAMPLASCNIAVNAWQEGSGDPSPSNVRAIHGFSEVNAYQRAVNLWDEITKKGYYNNNGIYVNSANELCNVNIIPVKPNTSIYVKAPNTVAICFYNKNGAFIRRNLNQSGVVNVVNNAYYININLQQPYGTSYHNDVSINYPSTDTDYHAYTGNTYTIQLGQEVYGAEVDAVNGVAHVTHGYREFNGTENGWTWGSPYVSFYVPQMANSSFYQGLANWLKTIDSLYVAGIVFGSGGNKVVYITKYVMQELGITDIEGWKTYLSNHNLQIVYPLATPFDIQLTPQQIETLIGNNTIFADTGDIDLTFKDLDIAKRGNFREVFRLPS